MKFTKTILFFSICLLMTSCYSSHITVGNMTHDHPVKTVGTKKNHYLFGGLIQLSKKQNAKDFVGEAKHYKIRTSHKFIDVLIASLTVSIYTPLTVTYYMSEYDMNQKYQRQRDMFDEDDSLANDDDFLDFNNFEPKKNTTPRKFDVKDEFDEFRDFDEPVKKSKRKIIRNKRLQLQK